MLRVTWLPYRKEVDDDAYLGSCCSCVLGICTATYDALQDAARGIASLSKEAGLEVDEEEYLGSFRPSLMDVFYSWSKGKSFAEVNAVPDIVNL
jgi:ATP-dependent RNA helicase DOB1